MFRISLGVLNHARSNNNINALIRYSIFYIIEKNNSKYTVVHDGRMNHCKNIVSTYIISHTFV